MDTTANTIVSMLNSGVHPVIEIKGAISDGYDYAKGMRTRVIGYQEEFYGKGDDVLILNTSFEGFESFNKQFEQPIWHSDAGLVCWSESTWYPKDKKVFLYLDPETTGDDIEIVNDNSNHLYQVWISTETTSRNYVAWLESIAAEALGVKL